MLKVDKGLPLAAFLGGLHGRSLASAAEERVRGVDPHALATRSAVMSRADDNVVGVELALVVDVEVLPGPGEELTDVVIDGSALEVLVLLDDHL